MQIYIVSSLRKDQCKSGYRNNPKMFRLQIRFWKVKVHGKLSDAMFFIISIIASLNFS